LRGRFQEREKKLLEKKRETEMKTPPKKKEKKVATGEHTSSHLEKDRWGGGADRNTGKKKKHSSIFTAK